MDLARRPSPAGDEAHLARWLHDHLRERGMTDVRLVELSPGRANVVVGPDDPVVALYGHLDTSLTGDPELDGPATGRPDRTAGPEVRDGTIWGFGIGVAKAPTAAALVTLLAVRDALDRAGRPELAARTGALVAAGGTHRATPPWPADARAAAGTGTEMGVGVRAALEAGYRPAAALVAKGGAPGLLHEEPGSLYLALTVTDHYGAALVRPVGPTMAGAAAAVGPVLGSIERWRAGHLAQRQDRVGQLAADVVVGAIDVGLPAKPDVLSHVAQVSLYLTTLPGDDEHTVVDDLRRHLRHELGHLTIDVEPYGRLPGGRTSPDHPWLRQLQACWERSGLPGSNEDVTGWRGSTDGALLRAGGIPTGRLGPPLYVRDDDPRVEGVVVADLVAWASVWATAVVHHLVADQPT